MYCVAVFDDDRRQAEALAELIARMPLGAPVDLELFTNLDALAAFIADEGEPDICFMDIRAPLPGSDAPAAAGIQAVSRLFPAGSHTQVIYVTGFPEYCVPVYETRHTYLLLKPVRPDQLQAALACAVANLKAGERDYLALSVGTSVLRVPVQKIVYVENMRRKVAVHTTDGELEAYAKLSDLAEQLPGCFVRTHKSYLVNMGFIDRIDRKVAELSTGACAPVSRQRSAATREAFRAYLTEGMRTVEGERR